MKNVGRISIQVVGWSLAAVACALLLTAHAAQGSARVQAIRAGSAQYTTDGTAWNPLETGTVLDAGATVRTDAMGVVDLSLGKCGGNVRLMPGTTLALNTLSFDQGGGETVVNTELGLSTGRIQGVVKRLSAASRFEIKTPVGTCGIRGTKYEVSATGRVTVLEGLVEVFYTPAGATAPVKFDVPAGYTFDPSENGGRGGVMPTPANVQDQLEQEFSEMGGVVTEAEKVQLWIPMPTWNIPDRPFEPSPSTLDSKPYTGIIPIYNPTTDVYPRP